MAIRLASTYGIHQAKQVVDTVHHAAGSSAIFTSSAFERRFRDIHTVTQQLQGRQAHLETVGRYLLGLEPDQTFSIGRRPSGTGRLLAALGRSAGRGAAELGAK